MDLLKDQKHFRQDLFHRLSAISIDIPALRDRIEDISPLIRHFLQSGPGRGMRVTENAMDQMRRYAWPGNVRELRNVMELAVCVAQNGRVIGVQHLPRHICVSMGRKDEEGSRTELPMKAQIRSSEARLIENALRRCGGNKARAAKMLGLSRSSLYNKIERYKLDVTLQ